MSGMDKYKRFLEWVRLLALFSAVFIAELIIKTLENTTILFMITVVVTGLIAIASMHILELLVTTLFDRAMWLRRFILGESYIEGIWIDQVIDEDLYGIITIQIRGGEISMTGEQFDGSGNITATWEDYLVSYKGNTLRGIYQAPQFRSGAPSEIHGFSTYIFHGAPGKPPNHYSGFFADASAEGRRCQLEGIRITDKAMLAKLSEPVRRHLVLHDLKKMVYNQKPTVTAVK